MISCSLILCNILLVKILSLFYSSVLFSYPMDEPFLTLARDEVLYQMKRLQSHPSLAMISANNEIEVALAQNWFDIPADQMDKAKDDYRKLYLDVIMKAIQEVDKGDNRIFVVSSPSNGLESVNENYTARNPQDPLYGKSNRSRFLLGSLITNYSRRCALLRIY